MRFSLLALALLVSAPVLSAQVEKPGPPSPDRDWGWLALAVGSGAPHDLSGAMTANFGRKRVVQVGMLSNGVMDYNGGESAGAHAVHAGLGFSTVDRFSRVAVAAGPAVVWGLRSPVDEQDRYVSPGVALNFQAMMTPLAEFGLGVHISAAISPEQTVTSFGLAFAFEGNK